jgi:hypothetical protein
VLIPFLTPALRGFGITRFMLMTCRTSERGVFFVGEALLAREIPVSINIRQARSCS